MKNISMLTLGIMGGLNAMAGGAGPNDPTKPTQSAENVHITFTSDIKVGAQLPVPVVRLLESVQITPAADETNITHYNVYWGDTERNKLGLSLAPQLAHIPATGDGKVLSHDFPPNFKMEVGAKYVLVCTENNGVEFCGKDNNLELVWDDILKTAGYATQFKSAISANDEISCPGLTVLDTCGDGICNGNETAESCPSDCETFGVASFNFQAICNQVQKVFHPTSVAEIEQIIKDAKKNNLHVKVTAAAGPNGTSGSASGIVCSDGVLIIVDKLDMSNTNFVTKMETYEGVKVVNVPAATRLYDLGEWLYKNGKQLGFVHLGWADATVAGSIGTSAHGSSPNSRNVLSNQVVSMDIINPEGEFKTYSRGTTGVSDPDLWKAMTTHLGYFGVITGVRLEIEDAQNVHVKVTFHDNKELFDNENPDVSVYEDIKDCAYGQYNWFPTLGKYMKWCGNPTDKVVEKGASNTLLSPYGAKGESPLQPKPVDIFKGYQVGACFPDTDTTKILGALRMDGLHLTPPMLKDRNGKSMYTSDAVGPLYKMTSAHLVDVGREVFQMDWEVAVPFKNMDAALKWVNNYTQGLNAKNRELPMPLVGIFVRFSKVEDETLLSYTGAGGDFEAGTTAVHIEMPIWVPINLPAERLAEYISPYETAMHTLITDFGGRAHWGKNEYWSEGKSNSDIFTLQKELNVYGDRLVRFNKAIAEFDPKGMFANQQAKVIGIEYPEFTYPKEW